MLRLTMAYWRDVSESLCRRESGTYASPRLVCFPINVQLMCNCQQCYWQVLPAWYTNKAEFRRILLKDTCSPRVMATWAYSRRICQFSSVGFSSSTSVEINVFNTITLKSSPLLDYEAENSSLLPRTTWLTSTNHSGPYHVTDLLAHRRSPTSRPAL